MMACENVPGQTKMFRWDAFGQTNCMLTSRIFPGGQTWLFEN